MLGLTVAVALFAVGNAKTTFNIHAISSISGGGMEIGQMIIGAEKLRMDEVNADDTILADYEIVITPNDVAGSGTNALLTALNVTGQFDSGDEDLNTTVIPDLPFVLGAPWSSLSLMTNPALSVFDWSQMASSATSIQLSSESSYPTFFRSVPSDALQSQGLVHLCSHFNWTRIGILYNNDNYGIYLAVNVLSEAKAMGVSVSSIGYTSEDDASISSAVAQLAETGVLVTILAGYAWDMPAIMSYANSSGIWGYPYYYLGVDGWIDSSFIASYALEDWVAGYMGTSPWQPGALAESFYTTEDLMTIYEKSEEMVEHLNTAWDAKYIDDPSYLWDLSSWGWVAAYGWECATALTYALDIYDSEYDLMGVLNGSTATADFKTRIKTIITTQIQYLGMTGNVSFAANGDRANGLYGFVAVDADGGVNYVGIFLSAENEADTVVVLDSDIVTWPADFEAVEMSPHSEVQYYDEIIVIKSGAFSGMMALAVVSIIITLVYVFLTFANRSKKIIVAASWKLNIVMCFGGLLAYISAVLFGIDERTVTNLATLDFLCNFRMWLLIIAFTLTFTPLFMKTYRISKIFTSLMVEKKIEDFHLLKMIAGIVCVDVLLLVVLTAASPMVRKYREAGEVILDELRIEDLDYGVCEAGNGGVNVAFGVVLGIWKLLQILWGIYLVSIVCRIGIRQVAKFDETGPILGAIIGTCVILAAVGPLAFVLPIKDEDSLTGNYVIIAMLIIVITNVALGSNLLPRLLAIIRNKEHKYEDSPEEKMQRMLVKRLKKLGLDQSHIDEITSRAGTSGSKRTGSRGGSKGGSGNKTPVTNNEPMSMSSSGGGDVQSPLEGAIKTTVELQHVSSRENLTG